MDNELLVCAEATEFWELLANTALVKCNNLIVKYHSEK